MRIVRLTLAGAAIVGLAACQENSSPGPGPSSAFITLVAKRDASKNEMLCLDYQTWPQQAAVRYFGPRSVEGNRSNDVLTDAGLLTRRLKSSNRSIEGKSYSEPYFEYTLTEKGKASSMIAPDTDLARLKLTDVSRAICYGELKFGGVLSVGAPEREDNGIYINISYGLVPARPIDSWARNLMSYGSTVDYNVRALDSSGQKPPFVNHVFLEYTSTGWQPVEMEN